MWTRFGKRRWRTWRRGMSKHLVIDASFASRLLLPGPHQKRCQTLAAQMKED